MMNSMNPMVLKKNQVKCNYKIFNYLEYIKFVHQYLSMKVYSLGDSFLSNFREDFVYLQGL